MTQNKGNTGKQRQQGQFIADPGADVVTFEEIQAAMGMSGDRLAAADIVGKTFDIIRAKPFNSARFEGKQAFFCVIRMDGDPDEKTVVLGGVAIVDVLNDIAGMGLVNPLRVTLLRGEGEKETDRFYYFG